MPKHYLQFASLTQSIYSCQIFSLRPPHTVAPSQAQASNGTGGLTPVHAAKANTPYPPACSSVSHCLVSLQPPSTLPSHAAIQVQDIPLFSIKCVHWALFFLLSHWSGLRMKREKRDLSFCPDLFLYLKKGGENKQKNRSRKAWQADKMKRVWIIYS